MGTCRRAERIGEGSEAWGKAVELARRECTDTNVVQLEDTGMINMPSSPFFTIILFLGGFFVGVSECNSSLYSFLEPLSFFDRYF